MSVTKEDLQSFQAKHFPAAHAYPTKESDQFYIEKGGEEFYNDDEDLGYYPDGVQRTLTDEQIRIFRHSEIHALRREQQAREEEEEDRAKHLREVLQNTNTEGKEQGHGQGHGQDKVAGPSSALDYDDGQQQVDKKPQRQPSGAPFAGRRIVSYED